jgi:ELWxxDGT repeat protein
LCRRDPGGREEFMALSYFGANNGSFKGLWVTDGTVAGTQAISAIAIASSNLTTIGSRVFFTADAGRWVRALDLRRNSLGHFSGQGYSSWPKWLPADLSHQRQRHALFRRQRRDTQRRTVEIETGPPPER